MKFFENMLLIIKSQLTSKEKKLLTRIVEAKDKGAVYKIPNYTICKMIIKIGQKIDNHMDYLYNKNQFGSVHYNNLKELNISIAEVVREYSMNLDE